VSAIVLTTAALTSLAALTCEAADESRASVHLDPKQRQTIGLTYGAAERRAIEKVIRTVGRFEIDERTITEINLKVGGYIEKLFVDYTGKPVRTGEPLFTIYSPDLVSAEQEYLLARQTQKALGQSPVPSVAESAVSLLRASRERLRLWGLSEAQIRGVEEAGKPDLYQTIRSPASGVVLEKMVVAGQNVQPGMPLYRIADLSTVWVYGDVYEYELPFVKVGQKADIRLSFAPDRRLQASVAYISPTLDAKTRTIKVRFDLRNTEDLFLRPGMYGDVELRVPLGERLVVPKTAVLDSGRQQVVFVDGSDGHVSPRDVTLGDRVDDFVEVKEGLSLGERVVTSANFLVDSESQLQGAESMAGMMGAIGMGDWKMAGAKPMSMGEESQASRQSSEAPALEEKKVGDLLITLLSATDAAKVGDSAIRVRVRDSAGAPLAQGKVTLDYSMDMPGMTIERAVAKQIGGACTRGS
jgi:Cu(I)/Ag(I) efflux system membrane fusion protein